MLNLAIIKLLTLNCFSRCKRNMMQIKIAIKSLHYYLFISFAIFPVIDQAYRVASRAGFGSTLRKVLGRIRTKDVELTNKRTYFFIFK